MDIDTLLGWGSLGATIGGAAGTLLGIAIGFQQERGKSREDAISDAVDAAENLEVMSLED